MSDGDWRLKAKCRGRIQEWGLESIRNHPNRDLAARQKCAGCTVLIDCGRLVWDNPDTVGTIAAGMVIEGDSITPESVRERLADLLDIEYVSAKVGKAQREAADPIPCSRCGHPTITPTAYRLLDRPEGLRRRTATTGLCEACTTAKSRREKVEVVA